MWQLTKAERAEIMILHQKWYSARQMSGPVGRHHSTISRELKRNAVKWEYAAKKAHLKAYQRRHKLQKQLKKIRLDEELEEFIRQKLKKLRSPQRIAWNRSKDNPLRRISHVTVYKYIYSTFGSGLWYYLYTQRHKPKRRREKKTKRSLIPNRVWIDARPEIIGLKMEVGHYECDLFVSGKWCKTVVLTLIEMVTRKSMARVLPNKSPQWVLGKLLQYIKKNDVKSITFDNWIEFMYHYKLWVPTYFCHPYSSREKPQIERRNRDYRRIYKKGSALNRVTQEHLDTTTERINTTPMVCLSYRTPHEIFTNYS
jgi:IS30 family transposase